jgi:hypothetical protein
MIHNASLQGNAFFELGRPGQAMVVVDTFEEEGDVARVAVWVRAHDFQPGHGGYVSGYFGGTGLYYGEQSRDLRVKVDGL